MSKNVLFNNISGWQRPRIDPARGKDLVVGSSMRKRTFEQKEKQVKKISLSSILL